MTNTFLLTRSRRDPCNNYLFYWSGLVIKEAERKNFKVLDLKEEKANKEEFYGRIKKIKPEIVFLNGHGSPDKVTGHDNKTLVSVNDDLTQLKNSIIYALSCSSAKNLGRECILSGVRSFIGYDKDFMFSYSQDKMTRPLEDETAQYFLSPSNLVVTSLIKGNTAKGSFERSQKEFKRNIKKLSSSEVSPDDKKLVPWLIWDMLAQVCLGDGEAKL